VRRPRRIVGSYRIVSFGLVTLIVAMLPAPSALAAGDDRLATAQAKITQAQAAADRAAVEYDAAQTHAAELSNEVDRANAKIDSLKREQARLAEIARNRAIRAYKGGVGDALDALLGSGNDALDSARRAELLNRANERGDQAIDQLEATTDDLGERQKQLRAQLTEQKKTVSELESRQEELQDALQDATTAANQLRAELERQRRAAEYVRLVAKAREAARAKAAAAPRITKGPVVTPRAATSSSNNAGTTSGGGTTTGGGGSSGGGGAGQVIGSGSWICPVQGPVSFTDTYGAPRPGGRRHMGVDMFTPFGTPIVAVMSGSVFFQGDPAGGNAAYLQASDGNTYYYAHLSQYVGGARNVAGGEVIGLAGNTGTSGAPPHLHFEIRIGGPNGTRINPYPTVAAHC
jgi:murein DD-endopeptidase MepM/ murein hydrolase activator NlpD